MGKIRVLHVVTIMNRGGIESMLMSLYRNMNRDEVQFDFLVHRSEKGDFDDEIHSLGGNIYSIPAINPFYQRKYLKALDSFFAKHNYKIVHSHINTFSMYILRSAKKAGIPCRIAHSHIDTIYWDIKYPFKLYCKMNLNKYPTYRFACSEKAGKWLFGNEKFQVINNAIELVKYEFNKKNRDMIRAQLTLENDFVLGHIGRFTKQKNHIFLVDVFSEIVKIYPRSKLVLVGMGEQKDSIEQKVSNLKLSSNVLFLGVRKDIPELLSCMDCFVFPSIYEGLPVALIEAQANGINIIASDSITDKVKITPLISFLSLNKSASFWANEIRKHNKPYERKSYLSELQSSGYDVKDTTMWLQKFYTNIYEDCHPSK